MTTKTTILDFWAPWCGQCTMLSKMIDQLSTELKDKATITKVNVDDASGIELAKKYSVTKLPTLVFVKNDEEVDRIVGMTAKTAILNSLKKHEKDNN
jgi:thioredoxin 1